MAQNEKKDSVKLGKRCYIGEFASPEARWLEDAECSKCGSDRLMDARGAALCVECNKFVKPKKKGK